MKLGFVSAILPDLPLDEVAAFAAEEGYECVELMCWPRGGAERRYAGVTHVDVSRFGREEAARVRETMAAGGATISALGYYPNPLSSDRSESAAVIAHLRKVIRAAELLGVKTVNTFIGRDGSRLSSSPTSAASKMRLKAPTWAGTSPGTALTWR